MSYFADLSDYVYDQSSTRPNTINVGWLDESHHFEIKFSSDDVLETIWQYCKVAVASTRGGHSCAFCTNQYSERNGDRLLLGTAEIRAFGSSGEVFAAPNLIYHYMSAHGYLPPETFMDAIQVGPNPPSSPYFEKLRSLDLEWQGAPQASELGAMTVEDYPRWKKLNVSMNEYKRMRLAGTLPEDTRF